MSSPTLGTPTQPSGLASDIIQRRNESKKWLKLNYWDEWVDVYRMIKCRTIPIKKLDSAGKETTEEDRSRTNIESGLANLIFRKNVARLSAQPYTLRVRGGSDPTVAARLSALLGQQYDRSQERAEDVRVRMAAESLGIGISKVYWDFISQTRQFRKALLKGGKVAFRDRSGIMKAQGAPDDEIEGAVGQLGTDMSDEEVQEFSGKTGTEVMVPQVVDKYEGPRVKCCFPGDVYWEPFAKTLRDSSFVIESYRETDLWLKKMLGLKYKDQETGQQLSAFDPEAVDGLMRLDPEPNIQKGEFQELRDLFRTSVGKQDQVQYQFPRNLRVRKLYDILEEHKKDDDGRMWITWVSENYRDRVLGRMPYPWNFYGETAFTDEVPLPDMVDAIGDSTPRLLRFMFKLFNLQHCQNFDYVTNLIRRHFFAPAGMEFDEDTLEKGNFRITRFSGGNSANITPDPTPPLPPGAMERGASIMQLIGMFEPSLNLTTEGSTFNPQAGKTATTAVLQSKAADVLLNFKVDGRNLYLYQLGMKKIHMNQQMADLEKDFEIQPKYFGQQMNDALKPYMDEQGKFQPNDKTPWVLTDVAGEISGVKLNPEEIQEDFECEPEAGSYMSVDDDLKRQAAMELDQVAMQSQGMLDMEKVLINHLKTIKGIDDPESFIAPPKPPQPPIPKANFNIGLTGKLEDFPSVLNSVLGEMGMPPIPDAEEQGALNTLGRVSQAADHATNLTSEANPQPPPEMPPPEKKPLNKTTFTHQVKKGGENGNGTVQSLVHQFEGDGGNSGEETP